MMMNDIYEDTVTQQQLAHKPSKIDMRETKQLLNDFHIFADIPQFTTISALLYWRKEMIIAKLEGVSA